MEKNKLASLLRQYVKNNLSPTQAEQDLVANLYAAFTSALGGGCLLIGSYARFTASRPLHDLDILFVAGKFNPQLLNPLPILANLQKTIEQKFKNPTTYQFKISQQTHSVTVSFLEGKNEKIAVDIVPAFTSAHRNEFGENIYWVPEILKTSRRNRQMQYKEFAKTKKNEIEWWIKSDPQGYIQAATNLNAKNSDFRKTAKLIKRWKHNCTEKNEDFGLKSFHIEQIVFGIYEQKPRMDIVDVIFNFFCNLPDSISYPQIKDRADQGKLIDEYLNDLTDSQKKSIIQARDSFLIKLENLSESTSIGDLLAAEFHKRSTSNAGVSSEKYLFDFRIPTFIEASNTLKIRARALQGIGGFREKILDALGIIERERKIEFREIWSGPQVDQFKWKVKNDHRSGEPRGEITDNFTRHDPESTKYRGSHYVECYAIKDGVCIARARQDVVLGSDGL